MAKRGGGYKSSKLNIDYASLGINKAEAKQISCLSSDYQLFPHADPPLRLDIDPFLVSLKQEYRVNIQSSSFYQKQLDDFRFERYTDRYKNLHKSSIDDWEFDKRVFPREIVMRKKSSRKNFTGFDRILANSAENEIAGEEGSENEENENVSEDGQEEEVENSNDYEMSYFDNGEDYIEDDDEDGDEGAVY